MPHKTPTFLRPYTEERPPMPFGLTRRLVGQYGPPVALTAALILAWEALVRWLALPRLAAAAICGSNNNQLQVLTSNRIVCMSNRWLHFTAR